MLIALEGVDKSGKRTQAERLRLAFADAKVFSFPRYETPLGALIKRHLAGRVMLAEERSRDSSDMRVDGDPYWATDKGDPLAFQCMMLADRYEAAPEIRFRQDHKLVTICDRYWPSGYAYGAADGLDLAWLVEVHKTLPPPDLCVLIDLPVEVAMARGRTGRPDVDDRYERDREKLTHVRNYYLKLWDSRPSWLVLNGTLPADEIYITIMRAVRENLGVDLGQAP